MEKIWDRKVQEACLYCHTGRIFSPYEPVRMIRYQAKSKGCHGTTLSKISSCHLFIYPLNPNLHKLIVLNISVYL
jgi:hypothetical protein